MNAIFTRIGHRHDDERLDRVSRDQTLHGFVHAPFNAGKGSRGVEHILAVVEIEHRITMPGKSPVAAGQINQHITPVAQDARLKLRMGFDVPGKRVFFFHRRACIGEENPPCKPSLGLRRKNHLEPRIPRPVAVSTSQVSAREYRCSTTSTPIRVSTHSFPSRSALSDERGFSNPNFALFSSAEICVICGLFYEKNRHSLRPGKHLPTGICRAREPENRRARHHGRVGSDRQSRPGRSRAATTS